MQSGSHYFSGECRYETKAELRRSLENTLLMKVQAGGYREGDKKRKQDVLPQVKPCEMLTVPLSEKDHTLTINFQRGE